MRITLLAMALSVGIAQHAAVATTNDRGLDRRNLDTTTPACKDFYQHANGSWLKNNPIPAQYPAWGISNEMRERNLLILKEILETSAKSKAESGSNAQKIGDFYASGMDEAGIEKAGYTPIEADLNKINAAKTNDDIIALVNAWHAQGLGFLFDFEPEADLKNSSMNIAYAGQGGLGLPERDYYLRDDEESKTLRTKYLAHVVKTLTLIGISEKDAKEQADWIMSIETRLAKASMDKVSLRDPANFYNIVTVAQAEKHTPHFKWSVFFSALELPEIKTFSLAQPDFFTELDKMLAEVPTTHWQAYLRWHFADGASPYLSSAFVNENFEFSGKVLTGSKELRPRWKRVMDQTSGALGEALGQLFVARTFPPEAKAKASELVENLRKALRVRLQNLKWMSDETKQKAFAKLEAFRPKIGYPDQWRDYSKLAITRGHYLDNVRAAVAFEQKRKLAKVNQAVDKNEWHMTPQTVNAYYNPLQNEIVFPAAILQPPYFDPAMDDAVNYGAMGAIIGHEMLHGFDDQGSKFDAAGNMVNWWNEEDRKQFEAKTDELVKQFNAYEAVPGLKVNGALTLGENIADYGGLLVALDALKLALTDKKQTKIDGFTQEQRFFLSWAQSWRRNSSPEAIKLQVNTDPHSPSNFRVIGPISNMSAFQQAFSCKETDAMVRSGEKRIDIW
jgi:putative endopeptidase